MSQESGGFRKATLCLCDSGGDGLGAAAAAGLGRLGIGLACCPADCQRERMFPSPVPQGRGLGQPAPGATGRQADPNICHSDPGQAQSCVALGCLTDWEAPGLVVPGQSRAEPALPLTSCAAWTRWLPSLNRSFLPCE